MYDVLARYYDWLVKDPQAAERWVEWIGKRGKTLLDCGCGSGEITALLAEEYEVTGIDLSREMIHQAKAKFDNVHFECRDMTNLDGLPAYDVITCLCDSFNYLDSQHARTFFSQAAAHLNPGGWLLFDSHSLDRLTEFEEGYCETGTFEDGTQVQWVIESEEDRLYQDFAFYLTDGSTVQEHHEQWVYAPEVLEKMLGEWFEIVEVSTDFDVPGIGEGEKYFYVCEKRKIV